MYQNYINTYTLTHRSMYLHLSKKEELLCPYTDKQRLIKITLKCSKAFLAPAFIKIPTFLLAQYIYQKSVDVRFIHRNGDILPKVLGLVLYSQSLSLTPPLPFFVPLPSAPPTKPFHMWVWCWRNYTQNRVQYWMYNTV